MEILKSQLPCAEATLRSEMVAYAAARRVEGVPPPLPAHDLARFIVERGEALVVVDDTPPTPPTPVPDPAVIAEAARIATYDTAITGDAQLQALKEMDRAAFDAWWAANVTTAAQAIAVLKKLTWLLIRYVLR